jgi:hypothetical protein
MSEAEDRLKRLESEIERRLVERFAGLRDEFDRLRLESDRRWAGFLSRFDQDFGGLVPVELLAPEPAPPAVSPAAPAEHVSIDDARSLDEADNQVEVLRRFLELVRGRASRAALFVSRSGSLGAWKAIGFSERGGNDEAVRRVTLAQDTGAIAKVLQGEPARLTGGNQISSKIGAPDAVEAILIPMVVKEKVSGFIYADCAAGEQERFQPESIALLTYLTGLVVDRLAARKLRPSPALRPFGAAQAEEPAPEPLEAPVPEPAIEEIQEPDKFELAPEAQPSSFAAIPSPVEPTAPPPVKLDERRLEVDLPPAETVRMPAVAPVSEAGPPPGPSGGVRRLAGPLAPAEGDERREEARRFARLLVSEIKLYNERVVQEGRAKGDIYERLREDIDRSRQMYDDRIPEDVRANTNFFYDELVRVLADGRPDALGI